MPENHTNRGNLPNNKIMQLCNHYIKGLRLTIMGNFLLAHNEYILASSLYNSLQDYQKNIFYSKMESIFSREPRLRDIAIHNKIPLDEEIEDLESNV